MNQPISIVIPMYNAKKHINDVLEAIFQQDYSGQVEVIVVNDGSTDNSLEIVKGFKGNGDLKIIDQPNQGAVAATNNGFKAAIHDIICSIDSDVVIHKEWLHKIIEEFDDSEVGAVQGYIKTPEGVSFLARMAGYDLEHRYDRLNSKYTTQVSTANTAYRKSALKKAGHFNPEFKYGYDNDISYRLQKAGYKLVFSKDALCKHYWKTDLKSYIKQQYWSAYGRMQLIRKHTERIGGDTVSGLRMILQVPLTMLFFTLFIPGLISLSYICGRYTFLASLGILGIMLIDRFLFAVGIFIKQRDFSVLFLPFLHLLRNMVWCWAFLRWGLKWIK
mgnify:FL=1